MIKFVRALALGGQESYMTNMITESDTAGIDLLLDKVYRDAGHDFREYKRGMVSRRMERRLHATGVRTYSEYMRFLDNYPEEYQRLVEYLTIKVSGFFRSPYTFQQVDRLVLPELIAYKKRQGERILRFWSTACARGEEPYSIAILLNQFLGHGMPDFDTSVHATDISRQALEKAQAGVYSSKDVEGLATIILESCFTRSNEGYTVNRDIRKIVSFSCFDLTSTIQSPFVDIDCIFCCNVLIYLQPQLQERVLSRLYDSLATPGYLILGEMETATESLRKKLECLDAKAKIYKKF